MEELQKFIFLKDLSPILFKKNNLYFNFQYEFRFCFFLLQLKNIRFSFSNIYEAFNLFSFMAKYLSAFKIILLYYI